MFIEFALEKKLTPKQKGDLLENLAQKILENQHYKVENEVRKTGIEVDLVCKHKNNKNKKIYVECKAYKRSKKIQADIIYTLLGKFDAKKDNENIEEIWLITTSELGKEAKGLKDELLITKI
jgi:predicted AAA+ superfamily ATPase